MTASLELEDTDENVQPRCTTRSNNGSTTSLCVGCGGAIMDKFILRVQPDLEWHARCLRCVKCNRGLDEKNTCFVKDGKTYCKEDYQRLFLQVCASCHRGLHKSDYVLRISGTRIYHISCFKCVACKRLLQTGDEFTIRPNGVVCLDDCHPCSVPPPPPTSVLPPSTDPPIPLPDPHSPPTSPKQEPYLSTELPSSDLDQKQTNCCRTYLDSITDDRLLLDSINNNNIPSANISRANSRMSYVKGMLDDSSMNSDLDSQDGSSICGNQSLTEGMAGTAGGTTGGGGSSLPSTGSGGRDGASQSLKMAGGGSSHGGGSGKRSKEQKTTRVRTVLNEKQLHTLRTCYAANPRPDALMKEQLVEMTGLSPRVIRVWFQNKRCKDKKRQIMVKQMDQHQQVGGLDCPLQGVPLVAGSPMRNEGNPGGPLDIQQLPGPWPGNDDYPATSVSGDNPRPPSESTPAFQQLISAYHHLARPPPHGLVSQAGGPPPGTSNLSLLSAMGLLPPPPGAHHQHHGPHHRSLNDLDDSPPDTYGNKLIPFSVD